MSVNGEVSLDVSAPSEKVSAPPIYPVGTVFAGKYCVEGMLGRGGMGVVLAARHMDLGHRVAIKVLHDTLAEDSVATERFQREAKASVSLESEHVAHVIDVGTEHGAPYMIMEFLEGEDLASVLKSSGKIAQEQAVTWILEACDAVAAAHAQGIIHRDLKPANLFLTKRKRGDPIIKVLDFGISKATPKGRSTEHEKELTETQTIIGTPLYASPEQLRGDHNLDTRSDIWSLGVLLHRLLSGKRPFESDTAGGLISAIAADQPTLVRDTVPDVDEGVQKIILRCLEKRPDTRFQSVAELARALEPFAHPDLKGMAKHIAMFRRSTAPEPSTRRESTLARAQRVALAGGEPANANASPAERRLTRGSIIPDSRSAFRPALHPAIILSFVGAAALMGYLVHRQSIEPPAAKDAPIEVAASDLKKLKAPSPELTPAVEPPSSSLTAEPTPLPDAAATAAAEQTPPVDAPKLAPPSASTQSTSKPKSPLLVAKPPKAKPKAPPKKPLPSIITDDPYAQ